MGTTGRILVVDDDPAVGTILGALLDQAGFQATYVESGQAALAELDARAYDVVVTDVRMPGLDGMELLDRVVHQRPDLPVVLLTAHGTISLAVDAMKRGASDYLLKPFDRDEILFVINKALAATEHRAAAPERPRAKTMVGKSEALREVDELVRRAARGKATVLIRGESGTGKELVARALHDTGPWAAGPFVKIHCAALPETLLESELFGYEKGAFTGANSRKPGRIELAHGGTLFLDEVGDIPLTMQVKLLRVIQDRELERLGGRDTLRVDVRFVAATHRDLEGMVAREQFREDLFYRLNVVPIWLPPLRDRSGDVELLVRHFCAIHARANSRPAVAVADDVVQLLAEQPWPGNVRQLENFIERLVVLSDDPQISVEDVRRELVRQQPAEERSRRTPGGGTLSLDEQRKRSERESLTAALTRAGNNRTLAARLLGVSRRTLYTKLEEHRLL
jgi:two-component system, NtrC family, response regulator AtoC